MGYVLHAEAENETYSLQTLTNYTRVTLPKFYVRRINANAVLVPTEKGTFIFPCAIGIVKLAAKVLEVRTFDQIRHTEEGEEHRSDLRGETDETRFCKTATSIL